MLRLPCVRCFLHWHVRNVYTCTVAARRRGLYDLRTRCEKSVASRRGLCDLRTRCEEGTCTCFTTTHAACISCLLTRPCGDHVVHMLRACNNTCCVQKVPADYVAARRRGLCDLRTRHEESAASRRGLCDLRTRCDESAARRRGPKKSPTQSV